MLVDRPGLVRVRLELARAFFLKGENDLSRKHFEHVLAGSPPGAVAANVRRFLSEIRARRRWSLRAGFALAPDTNIGGTSAERIIYINNLPFRRNAEELTTSGIGTSIWTGWEYQHPLGERLRLRTGADVSRREYAGSRFDQAFVSGHAGPRWLVGANTEASVLASAHRRWSANLPDYDALGGRIEAGHRFTRRVTASARASWHDRRYRTRMFLDGPVVDASLSGAWVVTPTVRADAALGWGREQPEGERWRHDRRWLRAGVAMALPRGFTVGGSGELRWTDYEGNWFPFTASRRAPGGPDPFPAGLSAQPGLRLEGLQPATLAGTRGADDQCTALRLQAHRRRIALRAPFLTPQDDHVPAFSLSSPACSSRTGATRGSVTISARQFPGLALHRGQWSLTTCWRSQ